MIPMAISLRLADYESYAGNNHQGMLFGELEERHRSFQLNFAITNPVNGHQRGTQKPGGVLPQNTYTGMCRPTGS